MIDKLSQEYLQTLYGSLSLSQLLFAWAIVLCIASAIRFSWLEYKSLRGKFTLVFTGLAIPLALVATIIGAISTGWVLVSLLRGC